MHADDCRDCERSGDTITEIERELSLEGALDAKTRARLAEIAERCPVHETSVWELRIRSRLA